jgi:hypothetical protein
VNQLQRMQEIADRIGIDAREAALGLKLIRSGRMDLINEVIAGRLTLRSALARAQMTQNNPSSEEGIAT